MDVHVPYLEQIRHTMENLVDNPLFLALCSAISGGALTQIATSIIAKIRNKGEKMNDLAQFMTQVQSISSDTVSTVQKISADTITTIQHSFGDTIATVQKTYEGIIESEQKAVEMANRNYDMSQAREEKLLQLMSQDKLYRDSLERKNAQKRTIINKGYECNKLSGLQNPAEECAVLKANAEYYRSREHCETCRQEVKEVQQ